MFDRRRVFDLRKRLIACRPEKEFGRVFDRGRVGDLGLNLVICLSTLEPKKDFVCALTLETVSVTTKNKRKKERFGLVCRPGKKSYRVYLRN